MHRFDIIIIVVWAHFHAMFTHAHICFTHLFTQRITQGFSPIPLESYAMSVQQLLVRVDNVCPSLRSLGYGIGPYHHTPGGRKQHRSNSQIAFCETNGAKSIAIGSGNIISGGRGAPQIAGNTYFVRSFDVLVGHRQTHMRKIGASARGFVVPTWWGTFFLGTIVPTNQQFKIKKLLLKYG